MKKILYSIFALSVFLLTACSEDEIIPTVAELTPDQQQLIGTAVQFEPYVDDFLATRAGEPGRNHNGSFNTNDMMYIYQQYWDGTKWLYAEPPMSIYKFKATYLGSSGIFDKQSWKVYEGKSVSFTDPNYTSKNDATSHTYSKTLTEADSIIWESGKTIRFRSWVLSSLASNALSNATFNPATSVNYPDYMVSDWVTVSGPTKNIPMSMRHLGCRIVFYARESNEFVSQSDASAFRIAISTDYKDYMRDDNSDTNANDALDKVDETTARQYAENVQKVLDKMCWPGGVNLEDMSLNTCSPDGATIYTLGQDVLASNFIAEKGNNGTYKNVKHAEFRANQDNRCSLISIPYDMSNDGNPGEPLVLPEYTRFKIWLRDVNKGDAANTPSTENNYHIFSLRDIKKDNKCVYENGLTLLPGYSYMFYVGYNYKVIEIKTADNFSWEQQEEDLGNIAATDQKETIATHEQFPTAEGEPEAYVWWKDAIKKAIPIGTTNDYNPVFEIGDATTLKEFANLVNGNFKMGPADGEKELKQYIETEKKTINNKQVTVYNVRWYTDKRVTGVDEDGKDIIEYDWATDEDKKGYIFYEHYYPSSSDNDAYSIEDYLHEPFSFYYTAASVKRSFEVKLTNDIDLKDCSLETIGTEAHPYSGYFNGDGYLLKNANMQTNGQLFGYLKNGAVKNLCVETTHPFSLTGTCETSRILGCSIKAPSVTGTLAENAKGKCYFVGCIHEGNTTKPLVTNANDLCYMYGCMHVARGIEKGALIGTSIDQNNYASQGKDTDIKKITIGNFACNYFDTQLSPSAKAVTLKDGQAYDVAYNRMQYIRGAITHILCARNDFLIDVNTKWSDLVKNNPNREMEYYGAAPWKAMNYGIYQYNKFATANDICDMHYEVEDRTEIEKKYNCYPVLKKSVPTTSQYIDITDQYN